MFGRTVEGSGGLFDVLLDLDSIGVVDFSDNLNDEGSTLREQLPKSQSFSSPLELARTFYILISRWAIPLECMNYNTPATTRRMLTMIF